jgi:hypothetical protein
MELFVDEAEMNSEFIPFVFLTVLHTIIMGMQKIQQHFSYD